MQQSIRLSLAALGTAALSIASLPAVNAKPVEVAQGSASDLGVMSISLKDVVKPQVGVQAQTQAAGTPNQAGLGGFLPLVVGSNSVFFADVLANANFADINNSSSIINTTVAGTTISTSSRLGYRWLNGDRSWMYGLNAGYDTRPMSTGDADTGIPVYASRTAFFQQAAVNAEAVSDKWAFNAYALIPTGDTEQQLNTVYQGGALDTFGLDAGYNLTPALRASVGFGVDCCAVMLDGAIEILLGSESKSQSVFHQGFGLIRLPRQAFERLAQIGSGLGIKPLPQLNRRQFVELACIFGRGSSALLHFDEAELIPAHTQKLATDHNGHDRQQSDQT